MSIIIGHHVLLFFTVNINLIDDDQVLVWLGAKHYSEGLFYQPRFYGQAYSTMMEGLFAVPFIWLKMPVYYAVPLATHLIFLTPFLFTAFYLYKHNRIEKGIVVLAVLLCMPLGYDVLNSVPRGFINGMFFTSFFVISLINPRNYKYVMFNTFMACVGFLVNPNSILASIPVLFYLFLMNYKIRKYYFYAFGGLLLAIPMEFLLNHYYRIHPEAIVFDFPNGFYLQSFINSITHLNDRFAHIGLFIEESAIITLILFVAIAIYFFKVNRKWFFAFALFLVIVFAAFFGEKLSDGVVWPLYSYSRMFLAIPILFVFSIILSKSVHQKTIYIIVVVVIGFTVYKEAIFNKRMKYYSKEELFSHVTAFKLKDVFQFTKAYKDICKLYDSKIIITIGWTWRDCIVNYAGPAMDDNYPKTFKPYFERRRWRVDEERNTVYDGFIIYTRYNNLDSTIKAKCPEISVQRVNDHGTFHVYRNERKTIDFVKQIGAETFGF